MGTVCGMNVSAHIILFQCTHKYSWLILILLGTISIMSLPDTLLAAFGMWILHGLSLSACCPACLPLICCLGLAQDWSRGLGQAHTVT